mgnify:CR=1 FL=1
MKGIYLNEFSSRKDLEDKFEITLPDDIEIILAAYEYEGYEGWAFVVFRQCGQVYEVNASHCSCFGLEGQWRPEVIVLDELLKRVDYLSYQDRYAELIREKLKAALTE